MSCFEVCKPEEITAKGKSSHSFHQKSRHGIWNYCAVVSAKFALLHPFVFIYFWQIWWMVFDGGDAERKCVAARVGQLEKDAV